MMMAHAGVIAQAGASGPTLTLPTTNLLAAYDARLGVTNIGGLCSAWADQSGNGWHASQGTVGRRPAISTTGGFPSILFDGSDDTLSVPSITASAGAKSIYAVVSSSWLAFNALFNSGTPMFFLGSQGGFYAGFDGSIRSTGLAVAGGLHRCTYQVNASQLSFWRNGVVGSPVTFTTSAIGGTAAIGSFHSGALGNNFSGHILFLAIYNAARNIAVENYITQEWGV